MAKTQSFHQRHFKFTTAVFLSPPWPNLDFFLILGEMTAKVNPNIKRQKGSGRLFGKDDLESLTISNSIIFPSPNMSLSLYIGDQLISLHLKYFRKMII
jgi:hypothetical protein